MGLEVLEEDVYVEGGGDIGEEGGGEVDVVGLWFDFWGGFVEKGGGFFVGDGGVGEVGGEEEGGVLGWVDEVLGGGVKWEGEGE